MGKITAFFAPYQALLRLVLRPQHLLLLSFSAANIFWPVKKIFVFLAGVAPAFYLSVKNNIRVYHEARRVRCELN